MKMVVLTQAEGFGMDEQNCERVGFIGDGQLDEVFDYAKLFDFDCRAYHFVQQTGDSKVFVVFLVFLILPLDQG